jgi:hypothetical protein
VLELLDFVFVFVFVLEAELAFGDLEEDDFGDLYDFE